MVLIISKGFARKQGELLINPQQMTDLEIAPFGLLDTARPGGVLPGIDAPSGMAGVLESLKLEYNPVNGNLIGRTRNSKAKESFGYDDLDRLTTVSAGAANVMEMEYSPCGNIASKTGLGAYS